MQLIIDGHLDLAWNALAYDRDQTQPLEQLRLREARLADADRSHATVCLSEMRRGGVGLCIASLLARARPSAAQERSPFRTDIDHASQAIAYSVAQGQLAYYRLLEQQGQVRIVSEAAALDALWSRWDGGGRESDGPIGVVLCMEGADPIVDPGQVRQWWEQGLRAVSLAHYGPAVYGHGTPTTDDDARQGVTRRGMDLLRELESVGMMLDLTHTTDACFAEAIDWYGGAVFSSHTNCRALVPGARQFSDEQIRALVARGGVVGVALENSMLHKDWREGRITRDAVTLEHVADHIDHICQLAGNTGHAVIGSDLDGGFGTPRCPCDLDTIADLSRLGPILAARGYNDEDVAAVLHGNWLGFLRRALPADGSTRPIRIVPGAGVRAGTRF